MTELLSISPALSTRFEDALVYAHTFHQTQPRKGTSIPYISHLMAVTSLVLEHGGTEDQAIAALLHDAVEDAGGEPILKEIRKRFGDSVADMVNDCTDAWSAPKPSWLERKKAYLKSMPTKPLTSLLVSLADKTHNAEAIQNDYLILGEKLWPRFNGGAEGTRWYYSELFEEFKLRLPGPLTDRLGRAVKSFK